MDEVAKQGSQLSDIEARLRRLETEQDLESNRITAISEYARIVSDDLDSLRNTFNGNVNQTNREKAARLTASGYCGEETYTDDYGVRRLRNKECTVDDLRPPRK
jgi:hypothetical protein